MLRPWVLGGSCARIGEERIYDDVAASHAPHSQPLQVWGERKPWSALASVRGVHLCSRHDRSISVLEPCWRSISPGFNSSADLRLTLN